MAIIVPLQGIQNRNTNSNIITSCTFDTMCEFQVIYTDDWIIDVDADNLSIGEGRLRNFQTCRTGKTDLLQVVEKEFQLHIIRRNHY